MLALAALTSCKGSTTAPQATKGIAGNWTGYAQRDTANTAAITLSLTDLSGKVAGVALWRVGYTIKGSAAGDSLAIVATDALGLTDYWSFSGILEGDQINGTVIVGPDSYAVSFLRQ